MKYASDGGFSVDRERTEASVAILKEAGIVGESFAVDTLFGSSNQVVTFNKK